MHEGNLRDDRRLVQLGLTILDWMWKRGWDDQFWRHLLLSRRARLTSSRILAGHEVLVAALRAIIATLLAYRLTGDAKYAHWHAQVHQWSFEHFADPLYGEWYGYLHRDGRISTQ